MNRKEKMLFECLNTIQKDFNLLVTQCQKDECCSENQIKVDKERLYNIKGYIDGAVDAYRFLEKSMWWLHNEE